MEDVESTVSSLFDGGWRSKDEQELQLEYRFTTNEVKEICDGLSIIEKRVMEA